MAAVENVEWLNQNLLRAYPLREDADMTPRLPNGAVATGLRLPTCLIADFSFTVAFDDADGEVPSLTGVSHAGDGFSLEVSLGNAVLTTKTAKVSEHTVNRAYPLVGQGDNADCGGWIVLGDLARAAEELPEGVYRFEPGQVPFEVSTLRMAPRGVRSITAVGKYGLRTYAPLYGNVRIIAGSDMSVRNDAPNNAIWLQAESKTGYERTEPCDCGTTSTRYVHTINGMDAEAVEIIGDGTCVDVATDEDRHAVKISDTCSTPCCGCAELNFVESAIATINKSLATLNGYAEALRARVAELKSNESATAAAIAAYPGVASSIPAPAPYHVTLDQAGGTGGTSSVPATYGVPMPQIVPPTRTGYTFGGYYDAGKTRKYYNADGTNAGNWSQEGDATLYAEWTPKEYTMSQDPNGGVYAGSTDSLVVPNVYYPDSLTYGATTYNMVGVPTRSGYTFTGWYDAPTGGNIVWDASGHAVDGVYWSGSAASAVYAHDGNLNAYAQWAPAST